MCCRLEGTRDSPLDRHGLLNCTVDSLMPPLSLTAEVHAMVDISDSLHTSGLMELSWGQASAVLHLGRFLVLDERLFSDAWRLRRAQGRAAPEKLHLALCNQQACRNRTSSAGAARI